MDSDELIASDPKEEILEILGEQVKTIKVKLGEIKSQIEQTQQMVDREQQRNQELATELRTIQDNLDTVPRQDIQDKYEEALNARFRLATMQGQLEKFQANYEHLETEQILLSQIYSKLQGGISIDYETEDTGVGASPGANIIRIVQAQEEEKQRLARQIHDGPAQSLTNFILQTEICQRLFDRDPERAAEELGNLKNTASVTFQKVRDFIFDLRPMMLDDLGVIPTVRSYVKTFQDKNDIATELDVIGEERRLENHREVMLFRSVQELMGFARDYATATELHIQLDMSSDPIKVSIEDNGRGFDTETLEDDEESHSDARTHGIGALREKFLLIGGSMTVSSSEDSGTVVRLELPSGE